MRCLTVSSSQRVVLLAIEPPDPEPEYGWLNPGAPLRDSAVEALRDLAQIMEKPTCDHAGRLTREGWLWNTMDVVARAQSLFEPTLEAAPHLAGSFSMIRPAIGAHWEQQVVEDVYRTMPLANFSTAVLARYPERLAVLPVQHVLWSNWGRGVRTVTSGRSGSVSDCGRLVECCTSRSRAMVSAARQEGRVSWKAMDCECWWQRMMSPHDIS